MFPRNCTMKIMKTALAFCFILFGYSDAFIVDLFRNIIGTCSNSKEASTPLTGISPSCLASADSGSCDFYDCFEQRYRCGACGFSKDYGTYNCEKFYQPGYYNRFNDAGKRWISATGQCLTRTLRNFYTQDSVRCHMVKTTMLDHVSTCYLHNAANISFCDIFWDNRDALFGVYEAGDFAKNFRVLTEVMQIAGSCAGDRLSDFRTLLVNRLTPVVSRVGNRITGASRDIFNK